MDGNCNGQERERERETTSGAAVWLPNPKERDGVYDSRIGFSLPFNIKMCL